MSPKESDEIMRKRKFTLMMKTGSGIRGYCSQDLEKRPQIGVEVLPERNEFRFIYISKYSINRIETPWCSPLNNTSHFKQIYREVKKWAKRIESMYEEEKECMPQ